MKKHFAWILCAAAAVVGLLAFAASGAGAGTATDPLVTYSYVNQTFRKELMQQLEQELAQSDVRSQLDRMYLSFADGARYTPVSQTETSYRYAVVTKGMDAPLMAGQQLLVLSGSAVVAKNMMVDVTAGVTLIPGDALQPNHFYTLPADAEITATADLELLVR